MSKRKDQLVVLSADRGKRTSRLTMFVRLFAIVWSAILCGVNFLALLGLTIGVGFAFLSTLGGVGIFVLIGWFIVNLFADTTQGNDPAYRQFRKSGGDPYFDDTWFWPVNTDSNEIRETGGNLVICPNCAETYHGRQCPRCHLKHVDFVGCGACHQFTFDAAGGFESNSGITCATAAPGSETTEEGQIHGRPIQSDSPAGRRRTWRI